ncbi:Exostosin, GT47 domain [Dillenia turbinata]|uniref:Exostosin, GT47 domain n=1 Tax=Dillenia turbinata TaxID=194707 RepID=A0AAN8VJ22_9MAGN
MKSVLQLIAVAILRKICQCCYRMDRRKLFFLGAFMTAMGIVLQTYIFSFPLSSRILTDEVQGFMAVSFNSTVHKHDVRPLETVVETRTIPVAPIVYVNSTNEINSTNVNSTNEINSTNGSALAVEVPRRRKRRRRNHVTIMPPPSPPSSPPSEEQRYIWTLSREESLVYAKKEIERAPVVDEDPDLFAPLFRNLSAFKRSYELMEMVLKVYIYKEGERPIFHEPHLRGIYASEGWFMKSMEENKRFVTKDPEKAHLFYLPYSARQLQMAMYKPNSHNIKPLSLFLRDYVNMLAAKYPYWNRTHGSDHFLVACHDWGPYTLVEHEELALNTIKVLCNADVSEGIFKAEKDVSLAETTIRNPRRPQRSIGGFRVSQRPILAFFAGQMHGRVRPKLLKHWQDKDDDMRIYRRLPNRVSRVMNYVEHMKKSKFCLCPMGYEVNSPRIVEAIYYECVPVIIADNFPPPLSDVFDWSAFSVIVAEKDIPKLKEILTAIPLRQYLKMQINVKMVQKHFLWNAFPARYDLFHMILHSIWLSRLNQLSTAHADVLHLNILLGTPTRNPTINVSEGGAQLCQSVAFQHKSRNNKL